VLRSIPLPHHVASGKQSLSTRASRRRLTACCNILGDALRPCAEQAQQEASVQSSRRACSWKIRFCPKPLTACVTCQRGPSPPPGSSCSTISVPSASPASTRPSHTSSASIFFWKLSSTTSAAEQTARSAGLQSCTFAENSSTKAVSAQQSTCLALYFKLHCFDCSTCEGLEVRHRAELRIARRREVSRGSATIHT